MGEKHKQTVIPLPLILKVIHQIKYPMVGTDGTWVLPKTGGGQERLCAEAVFEFDTRKQREGSSGRRSSGERKQVTPLMWEAAGGL